MIRLRILILIAFVFSPIASSQEDQSSSSGFGSINVQDMQNELTSLEQRIAQSTRLDVIEDIFNEYDWVLNQEREINNLIAIYTLSPSLRRQISELDKSTKRISEKLEGGQYLTNFRAFSRDIEGLISSTRRIFLSTNSPEIETISDEMSDSLLELVPGFRLVGSNDDEPDYSTELEEALAVLENSIAPQIEPLNAAVATAQRIESELKKYKSSLIEYRRTLSVVERKAKERLSISQNLYFVIAIIGLLSIGVIVTIKFFPPQIVEIWVESGQVIQFVTVMILLSVILALGLVDVIKENTLGTLLGGIGGYVLAQGVGRSAASQALKEQETVAKLQRGAPVSTPSPPNTTHSSLSPSVNDGPNEENTAND